MKKAILFIGVLLLNCGILQGKEEVKISISPEGSIAVFSTSDLYNLTTKWANEFCNLNPNVQIKVINVTDLSISGVFSTGRNLGFISNEYYSKLNDNSIWKIVVGRDVIVPIINSKNPFLDEIYQQGISLVEFAQILKDPENQKWGTLLKSGQNVPVNYYMINEESINSVLANFFKVNQISLDGIKVENEKELISSIQKDTYAIGFCKMINILDYSNQSFVENIKLLPIDRNGNGKIDYIEKIYDNLNVLSRGVWIGKYPKALCNDIYSISPIKPTNEIEVAFLKWVLTDGQQFLNAAGYCDLVLNERQSKVDMLYYSKINTSTSNGNYATSKVIIFIIVGFIVAIFIVIDVVRSIKYKKTHVQDASSIFPLVFDEHSVKIPKGLYFDKTHTWVFMEKDGVVKIGIDDFLQHITGPLTRTKMKNAGETIKKGEQIFSIIQNGKQLNIYSPISGTIKEQNIILKTDTSLLNSSPYSDGWVYMIEPTNWLREIQFLIMENKYKKWLKSEFSRLKDFLAISVKPDSVEYTFNVLQDGGELKDGILEDLGPEVWEDFQTKFIDTSN